MKIGIIGAGDIGTVLTKRFSAVGHDVSVANSRGPETLAGLAATTGAKAVSVDEAAKGAEVVVVTMPEGEVPGLAAGVLDGAETDVVVIDTGNWPADGRIDTIENGTTESRWVSELLGHSVVKVVQQHPGPAPPRAATTTVYPGRIALPVAGDEPEAKAVVMRLIDEIGFDAVDAGGLDDSWRQQPGSPVYTKDLDAEGVRHAPRRGEGDPGRALGPCWASSLRHRQETHRVQHHRVVGQGLGSADLRPPAFGVGLQTLEEQRERKAPPLRRLP